MSNTDERQGGDFFSEEEGEAASICISTPAASTQQPSSAPPIPSPAPASTRRRERWTCICPKCTLPRKAKQRFCVDHVTPYNALGAQKKREGGKELKAWNAMSKGAAQDEQILGLAVEEFDEECKKFARALVISDHILISIASPRCTRRRMM